jgi:hypothetical protein
MLRCLLVAWSFAAVACRSGSDGDAGDAGSVPCVESCQEALAIGGVPCNFDPGALEAFNAYMMCLEEQEQDQQMNCQAELAACMMQ